MIRQHCCGRIIFHIQSKIAFDSMDFAGVPDRQHVRIHIQDDHEIVPVGTVYTVGDQRYAPDPFDLLRAAVKCSYFFQQFFPVSGIRSPFDDDVMFHTNLSPLQI